MKIENQVCTLEQAKRLKEIGVLQESEFYFRMGKIWHFREVTDWPNQEQLSDLLQSGQENERIFSAYTVAELGEMLPDLIEQEDKQYELVCIKEDDCWLCRYVRNNNMLDCFHYAAGETEAEARTNMLEYCIESNLTTIDQINKSITQ